MAILFAEPGVDNSVEKLKAGIRKLKKWDDAYYNTDSPLVTDAEYDKLREAMEKLYEKQKKPVAFADEYFGKVRAPVRSSKRSAKLPFQLGSLRKAKNDNSKPLVKLVKDARAAALAVAKKLRAAESKPSNKAHIHLSAQFSQAVSLVISPKLDGLTFLLHYNKGKLVQAWTGGDGVHGQERLKHALFLAEKGKLPVKLSKSAFAHFTYDDMFVVGEIVCAKSRFAKLIAKQKKRGDTNVYNNPRNAASGFLNADKPNPELADVIEFIAYDVVTEHGDIGVNFNPIVLHNEAKAHSTKITTLGMLKASKFKTYMNSGFFFTCAINEFTDSFKKSMDERLAKIGDAPFLLDGLVIEVADSNIRKEMGKKNGTPYYALAYKTSADDDAATGKGELTTLKSIEYNPSKSAALKPTLHFPPVKLDNTNVAKATGNNVDYLLKKGLGVGTKVRVVKAGGVIPKVIFEDKKKATADKIVPTKCSCGAKAVQVKAENGKVLPDYYCSKPEKCPFVQFEIFKAAVNSAKLTGLGAKNIRKLFDAGYTDIIKLIVAARDPKQAKKLLAIEGFGQAMLATIGTGLPASLNKMSVPELMLMSNCFMRPGLSLAKASFEAAVKATGGKADSSSDKAKIKAALGPAKGQLFIDSYADWVAFYKKLKTFK